MKKAELEFVAFDTEDVITTSGVGPAPDPEPITHYFCYGKPSPDYPGLRWWNYYQEYIGEEPVGEPALFDIAVPSEDDLLTGWYRDWGTTTKCGNDHPHPHNPPA